MNKKRKELLFSITPKDCQWDFYRGSGKGGQKRNKTENAARCTHKPSGAQATSEEGRSKEQNKKKAFLKMAQTPKFKTWLKLEAQKRMGNLRVIEEKIEKEINDPNITKIEFFDGGKWVKPQRKEKKRKPTKKDPHKTERQHSRKIEKNWD